jgi:hypothetical protein
MEGSSAGPHLVLLFSGHMIDRRDRAVPRFPAALEAGAARRLAGELDALQVGPRDLALSQAAAGSDLLFIEACQQRGVPCRVLLPFEEAEFIERSVLPSVDGTRWRERYFAAVGAANVDKRVMPRELGPLPEGADPFERCNEWLLESALAAGGSRVRFITIWNGEKGDGQGGTAHLVREAERHAIPISWIDTRELLKGQARIRIGR